MAVALTRDPETGRIIVDRDRCIGCWMCLMVCPHGAVVRHARAGQVIICDQCSGRAEAACAVACSTGAIEVIETSQTKAETKDLAE
jgi:carbon-monoxide dehydrogenase iron sulfur subunit